MSEDTFTIGPAEPLPYRPDIERPEPAPFVPDDPRDLIRAELHRRLTSPGTGSWDYVESTVSGQTLVVRLQHDDDGAIVIEVPLDDADPGEYQLLDVWIVELMDTGRSEPISVSDAETRYRLD